MAIDTTTNSSNSLSSTPFAYYYNTRTEDKDQNHGLLNLNDVIPDSVLEQL